MIYDVMIIIVFTEISREREREAWPARLCWEQEARWMCLVDWLREAVMDEIPGWADTGWETQTDNNQHDAQHILIITSQASQAFQA